MDPESLNNSFNLALMNAVSSTPNSRSVNLLDTSFTQSFKKRTNNQLEEYEIEGGGSAYQNQVAHPPAKV